MSDAIDLTIENLKSQLNSIKQRISQCRKKGLYTKIAELKITSIPSKIMMAEATKDFKDAQKVSRLLSDAAVEVENIEREAENAKDLETNKNKKE